MPHVSSASILPGASCHRSDTRFVFLVHILESGLVDLNFVYVRSCAYWIHERLYSGQYACETPLSDEEVSTVRLYFGSVYTTMVTFYQSNSGGVDWVLVHKVTTSAGATVSGTYVFSSCSTTSPLSIFFLVSSGKKHCCIPSLIVKDGPLLEKEVSVRTQML